MFAKFHMFWKLKVKTMVELISSQLDHVGVTTSAMIKHTSSLLWYLFCLDSAGVIHNSTYFDVFLLISAHSHVHILTN